MKHSFGMRLHFIGLARVARCHAQGFGNRSIELGLVLRPVQRDISSTARVAFTPALCCVGFSDPLAAFNGIDSVAMAQCRFEPSNYFPRYRRFLKPGRVA